jgi:murein DD-endopeptidase MepM/ murein hydrolase activator NlpD
MHRKTRHAFGYAARAFTLALAAVASIVHATNRTDAQASLWSRVRSAAAHEGLDASARDELVAVLAESIDLARPVQSGDTLVLLRDSHASETFVSVSFTASDADIRYYRFAAGGGEFYDAVGRSAARVLSRKPLEPSKGAVEQRFGWRSDSDGANGGRMHPGVDWAAPRGTAVFASADGTVGKVERRDTGIRLVLRHDGGYDSGYSYLSAIAVDDAVGASVRKRERIGTIGWNGAAGPVLHYEVLVNGRLVDPLRIRLPSLRHLEGPTLAAFHEERERLDRLMASATTYDLFGMK